MDLNCKIAIFWVHNCSSFPVAWRDLFPFLEARTSLFAPPVDCPDELSWKSVSNGSLTLKLAYHCKQRNSPIFPWAYYIWHNSIPMSCSLLSWRLLHKLSTDKQLQCRGIQVVSMCSLCKANRESIDHLFFCCSFAVKLWDWLGTLLHINIHKDAKSILTSCSKAGSKQGIFIIKLHAFF